VNERKLCSVLPRNFTRLRSMFVDTKAGNSCVKWGDAVRMRNARFLAVEVGLERARVKLDSAESHIAGAVD